MADSATTETLLGLPILFWSGIIAAGMTLIGTLGAVVVTNWGTTKRQKDQLEHDTKEKAKERLLALRRELYLKSVEANARAFAYFGSLPQADFTKPDADVPIRNLLAIGPQLLLVVRQGTAQLVSDVISSCGELQLKLIVKVKPMHDLRFDITLASAQFDNAQAEIKRVIAVMNQYNEAGVRDPGKFERLNRSFQFAKKISQDAAGERTALWDQVNVLQRQYMKDLIPEMKRLGELQMRLLVELRQELDVGGDIEFFKRIMKNQMDRMERATVGFDKDLFGPNGTPSHTS